MLTSTEIQHIAALFKRKGWPRQIGSRSYGYDLFEVTCVFLSKFSGDVRKLALTFVEKYDLVRDYTPKLEILIDSIPSQYFQHKCYVIPNGTEKRKETKSGHEIVQWFKTNIPRTIKQNLVFADSADSERILVDDATYLIVDDFVGSGTQALRTIRFLEKKGVQRQHIKLAIICIMEHSLRRIQKLGISVYYVLAYKKAIADQYATGEFSSNDAYGIYDDMFSEISIGEQYKYGYAKSETLLSMKATPNNTFPIFWVETAKGGGQWPAPFRK